MANKRIKLLVIATVLVAAGLNVYQSQSKEAELSDLGMANVEALASGEVNPLCPNGCVDGGKGCTCNGISVPTWREYDWGDDW